MEKEFYFETDDKLDRIKYAEFLKTLLEHCDEYRREDSEGAYVIAIDSPWGTGKTRFAKMLQNYLIRRVPKETSEGYDKTHIIQSENSQFNVIYYNSWETDYWNDALEPLLDKIKNSSVFDAISKNEKYKQLWDEFLEFSKGVLEASIDIAASISIWGNILKVLSSGIKKVKEAPKDPFVEYHNRLALYTKYSNSLSKIIKATGKKLVIIVDELDRCRPTFAIQTLELVKHLFKVEDLIFIFALDVEQLSSAARTIYGSSMDAAGYLCRFFDYLGKMPDSNRISFIELQIKNHRFFEKNEQEMRAVSNFFYDLTKSFSLSLRDIVTILTNYHIMLDTFLKEYRYLQFHRLYLFLLTLKYKNLSLYTNFILNKRSEENNLTKENNLSLVKKYIPRTNVVEIVVLNQQIQRLDNSNTLSSIEFSIYQSRIDLSNRESHGTSFLIETVQENTIKSGQIELVISTRMRNPDGSTHPAPEEYLDKNHLLYDVLEYNDVLKWQKIKNLSLGQYYYSQLEMFNFALPSDEPDKTKNS